MCISPKESTGLEWCDALAPSVLIFARGGDIMMGPRVAAVGTVVVAVAVGMTIVRRKRL